MFQRKIGHWLIRTGAVESGTVETRVTYRGRFVRRRVSATTLDAIETHRDEVQTVERVARAGEVAA